MLRVKDVSFSYKKPVLKGLSFEAGRGELLSVLGPNGSGKSSLLKIIVGILKPGSGSVLLDGKDLAAMPRREAAKLIGYVAQESSVRFPLTAMEFILQGRFAQGRLVGFESEEDLREAAWAMEVTGTVEFAARPLGELSGGERQRVMLARALASRPRLLVLDEPVANLDIAHQVKMLGLVKRLTVGANLSAIVVTHELNLAAEFATRVLMLKGGEALAFDSPREALTEERLKALFDADLLVDVNPSSGAPRVTVLSTPDGQGGRIPQSR